MYCGQEKSATFGEENDDDACDDACKGSYLEIVER